MQQTKSTDKNISVEEFDKLGKYKGLGVEIQFYILNGKMVLLLYVPYIW